MEREVLKLARQMAVDHFKPSMIRERAFLNGAYDHGTDVTQFIPAAEVELIRQRTENTEAE